MKFRLFIHALLLGCATLNGHAASLSLDFQPVGGTTAAGYQAFEAANQVLPGAGTSYAAFGTTVTVSLSVANLPDGNLDFRAVTRNGATSDATNDWIGVDTRNAGVDVTLSIIIAGLPSGPYTWLSQHHDGGAGATNGNLLGSADLIFVDASGSTGLVSNGIAFSSQNIGDPIATFSRSFTANGTDPISLSMIMDNAQGGGANALFAFANSVVIEQVPEPSAALLAVVIGAVSLLRRRRVGR